MAPPSVLALLKLSLWGALFFLKSVESADPEGYPPHWDQLPGKLDDFPKQNNDIVIQPWDYFGRMGMYKTLILSTNRFFTKLGLNSENNVLWGPALQLSWQFKSGRLADPSKNTTCGYNTGDLFCVSINSYWASVNYYLSVLPFLAAAEAGIFEGHHGKIQLLPPESYIDEFCYNISGCQSFVPKLMREWIFFFKYLKSVKPASGGEASAVLDTLLDYLWNSREDSADSSRSTFQDRLRFSSGPEVDFDKDWLNLGHFFEVALFVTDFPTMKRFVDFMPPRILTAGDRAPHIADFTDRENILLVNLRCLRSRNEISGGYLMQLWKEAVGTEEGREVGRQILKDLNSSCLPDLGLLNILSTIVMTLDSLINSSILDEFIKTIGSCAASC